LTRQRIAAAAERRFLTDGYAATTVAMVAADAGVAVDTVYKSFAGKAGLVRAIWQRALEGQGPVPAEQRSDALQGSESDPRAVLAGWGALTAEIAPRAAPILLLIRDAAATDVEVLALRAEVDAGRMRRMVANARRLHARGHLRPGMTVAQAADVLWTFTSAELYELLVIRRRWSPARYGRFVADAMDGALL
jgi:AcrR family transcriptional regulator